MQHFKDIFFRSNGCFLRRFIILHIKNLNNVFHAPPQLSCTLFRLQQPVIPPGRSPFLIQSSMKTKLQRWVVLIALVTLMVTGACVAPYRTNTINTLPLDDEHQTSVLVGRENIQITHAISSKWATAFNGQFYKFPNSDVQGGRLEAGLGLFRMPFNDVYAASFLGGAGYGWYNEGTMRTDLPRAFVQGQFRIDFPKHQKDDFQVFLSQRMSYAQISAYWLCPPETCTEPQPPESTRALFSETALTFNYFRENWGGSVQFMGIKRLNEPATYQYLNEYWPSALRLGLMYRFK